jgi:hypothetical protein
MTRREPPATVPVASKGSDVVGDHAKIDALWIFSSRGHGQEGETVNLGRRWTMVGGETVEGCRTEPSSQNAFVGSWSDYAFLLFLFFLRLHALYSVLRVLLLTYNPKLSILDFDFFWDEAIARGRIGFGGRRRKDGMESDYKAPKASWWALLWKSSHLRKG